MPPNPIYHPRFVRPDDPDYRAHMTRMRDLRPSRGGPRAAGEFMGGLVEKCVQHWLAQFVPLQEERILAYEQRNGRTGRMATFYRELDGVWQIDDESLCLFEMKFTFPENMERGVGLSQLGKNSDFLFTDPKWKYILKRLVYIAPETERVIVRDELPVLEPNDESAELGVIWVSPDAVEASAKALELELPENWLAPESREGHLEAADRPEWEAYLDGSESKREDENEDKSEVEAEEPEIDPNNPLAIALQRLKGLN